MFRRSLVLVAALAVVSFALPAASRAQDNAAPTSTSPAEHKSGGLGFHDIDAPLGVRWWFGPSQKVGVDLGFGFQSTPAPSYDEHLKDFDFAAGIPITLKSWHQFHFLFRPGFFYETAQVQAATPPAPFDTESQKTIRLTAELEAEAFLLDNFSVSASHGFGWTQFDPGFGADKETAYGTLGNEFTNIGFHVYLFGD